MKKLIAVENLKNPVTHLTSVSLVPGVPDQGLAVNTESLSGFVKPTFQQGETINNEHNEWSVMLHRVANMISARAKKQAK